MGHEVAEASFVVPCRQLDTRAPFRWLALGWQDLRRAPALSALFGLVTVIVSLLVSWLAWTLGRFALLAVLLSGFVFVAPLLGVAMYSVSRCLLDGETPQLATSLRLARRVLGQAGVFALIQLVVMLLWSRAGMMLTVFLPLHQGDPRALLEYLLIGSLVGSVFAALTFAVAVVSLPLIADRDVDMVTACISSVNAVLRNKGVMALWAVLIVLLTALGFATAFVGLGIAMPWLAYASFHAYRDTLDAGTWPRA
jgi:uncharacterized membrane protein